MPTYPYRGRRPEIDTTAFLAPGARVIGDVAIGPQSSVWFNAVLRGDADRIRVGARTNIQDNAVLHADPGQPCVVGDDCVVGHGAIVHGCEIGNTCLIGMGAIVLTGAVIGEESLVAAGALVPEGRTYPPRSLLIGSPAKRVRALTDEDVERLIRQGVRNYLGYVKGYGGNG